ncbi:MAG: hypothetical protein ONB23_11895 [candidate division KSB1 bacterium]|nr:hypothetical protein [candidate division KSB1 bacterium]
MDYIRRNVPNSLVWVTVSGLMVLLPLALSRAQTRTHDLGDFKLRIEANDVINTNDVEPTGEWPQDHFRYSTIVFHNNGFVVGKWIDADGTVHIKEEFFDPVTYNQTEPYGIKEYRRFKPPEVWVFSEGQWLLSSRPFKGIVDPNLPSDIMIEVRFKARPGFDVLRRSYSFSNPYHDDYVIVYNRYLVTFDWDQDPEPDTDTTQTLEDVYFIVGYCFQTAEGTWITYSRWYEEAKDDWATYEVYTPKLVQGGRNLVISYGWDGDHPEITEFEKGGREFDDTGDPRFAIGEGGATPMPSGEFISTAYAGFAALHVDKSPKDHSDDPSQPTSIITNINIYNVWDSEFPGFATIWDWAASGTKQTVQQQAGWPDDASAVEAEYPFQAFGPYDLVKGDSVVIVYAVGANGISRQLAIEKGLQWRDWYRGVAGATFDDNAKNALLATGRDSLFQTLDRALWAWSRGLDIPDPLPSPSLTVTSGPDVIYLDWEDLSNVGDPDTHVPDLDHYNIYRKRGSFLVDTYSELNAEGTHLLWEKIAEVPKGVTHYEDRDVIRGEPYHYAVTAVDDGTQNTVFPGQKLESSRYANRTEIPAYAFKPGSSDASKVRIIPNPYVVRAGEFNFTGEDDKILFVNLPPYCTLRIYTATGDLVKTIEHVSGSADESWDQVTDYNQLVASGVYILQIDNARDLNGKPIKGSIQKFVIIR